MQNISVADMKKTPLSPEKHIVVDVRMSERYAVGHIPQAVNIPLEHIEKRTGELKGYKRIYVYCQSGNKSQLACALLEVMGFSDAINIEGGMSEWERRGFETERM